MRADRLIAILLMLQQRTQVTAAEVADELEVSERTARRDLDALAVAGLPVYSQVGRGGGWRLAGDGRTDLSLLTSDEARSIVLAISGATGLGASTRTALQKLQAALPDRSRSSAMAAAAVTIIEPDGWEPALRRHRHEPPARLDEVHRATVDNERVVIRYRARDGRETEREIDPHAVVDHGGTWYVIAQTQSGRRTFRLDRITDVTPTGRRGDRPGDFDAAAVWREVRADIDELRAPMQVEVRVRASMVRPIRMAFGRRADLADPPPGAVDDTWVEGVVRGHSVASIGWELAGFGGTVEVVAPDAVRAELARIGRELVAGHDTGGR